MGKANFRSPLVGQFNLANLLAAVGTVLHLGLDLEEILQFFTLNFLVFQDGWKEYKLTIYRILV